MSALTVTVANVLARVAAEHVVVPCSDSRRSKGWTHWDQCSGCGWLTTVAGQHPAHIAAMQAGVLADCGLLRTAPESENTP